jgi:hypothetical protein
MVYDPSSQEGATLVSNPMSIEITEEQIEQACKAAGITRAEFNERTAKNRDGRLASR